MSGKSRLLQKLLIVFLLLNLLVCPFVFLGMMVFPQAIEFMEPVVCSDGMQMEAVSEQTSGSGGVYVLTKVFCVGSRQDVDVTWKLFLIMFGFPALGVVVFLIAPSSGKEKDEIILNPGGND